MNLRIVLAAAFFAACKSYDHKAPKKPVTQVPTQAQAEAAAKSQSAAYDRGSAALSAEDYPAARKHFYEAVRLNPDSQVGKDAKADLQKVENILRSRKAPQP